MSEAPCASTMHDPGSAAMVLDVELDPDLDDTQVCQPVGKKWKQDDSAKDMMTSCVEEAASKAAIEAVRRFAEVAPF